MFWTGIVHFSVDWVKIVNLSDTAWDGLEVKFVSSVGCGVRPALQPIFVLFCLAIVYCFAIIGMLVLCREVLNVSSFSL